jgi:hypothetical protein
MPAARSAGAEFGMETAASVRIARKPATGEAMAPESRWQLSKQGPGVVVFRCIGHELSFMQHDFRACHPVIDGTTGAARNSAQSTAAAIL